MYFEIFELQLRELWELWDTEADELGMYLVGNPQESQFPTQKEGRRPRIEIG